MEREEEEMAARNGGNEFLGKDSIFPLNSEGNAGKESLITHESAEGDCVVNSMRNLRSRVVAASGAGSSLNDGGGDGDAGFVVQELTVENCGSQNLGLGENGHCSSWQDSLEVKYGSMSGFRYMAKLGDSVSKSLQFSAMASEKHGFNPLIIRQSPGLEAEGSSFHNILRNRFPVGATQLKTLPKPSFSELFGKQSLQGKGILSTNPETCCPSSRTELPSSDSVDRPVDGNGISLRDLLNSGRCGRNKAESLRLFRLIVELVDSSHSQGVFLQDLRPSCFRVLSSDKIVYTASSAEGEVNLKRPLVDDTHENGNSGMKRLKLKSRMQTFGLTSSFGPQDFNYTQSCVRQDQSISGRVELEKRWYVSPEELSARTSTFSSNIYSLGVLLFELLCCSESWEVHCKAMLDLRQRILAPIFLSKNGKEAGFCLWLLHPEPRSRPTSSREILQSDFMCASQDSVRQDDIPASSSADSSETELLRDFLITLEDHKKKHASKLAYQISCLEEDIKEVESGPLFRMQPGFPHSKSIISNEPRRSISHSDSSLETHINKRWLMRNISKLGDAYFTLKSEFHHTKTIDAGSSDKGLVKKVEGSKAKSEIGDKNTDQKPVKPLGAFFENLCKFAQYSKFELCGNIRSRDLLSSPNVICSVSFDRDEDFFATAGISKRIKIFDFGAFMNDSIDIHYPVVEMSNRSKLSCVCWNSYIKNYLASTDYDGIVKMWDMSTGQGLSQYHEHQKRAWSVDFSKADPTRFASGSDDWTVKLWNINERNSLATLRSHANICSLQFSTFNPHLLAFGSADFKVYCYDLRHVRTHLCTLSGHEKSISSVKFSDSKTLVSASTDNSLKLWDLSKASSAESSNACCLTFNGHKNEKNFVGLSVLDGYIACGSETNEVFCYHKSFPMPITSYKFGAVDPISRNEVIDDTGQFVSSVCWRRKSNMLVAANSTGSIKLLKMV